MTEFSSRLQSIRMERGFSRKEIADILEENVNTIKSRLYRGLKKLQGILADESGQEEQKTDSEAYCSSGMQKRAGRG